MGKGLKLLVGGAIFGLLAVFAVIGFKSTLQGERKMVTQDNGFEVTLPQGSATTSPAGTTATTQDVPPVGTDVNIPVETITLEGEPIDPNDPAPTPRTQPDNAQSDPDLQPPAQAPTATGRQQQPAPAQSTGITAAPAGPSVSQSVSQNDDRGDGDDPTLNEQIGKLNLTLIDPASQGGDVDGEFLILDSQGLQVASTSGGNQASFDLGPGNYQVKVTANGKTSTRTLAVFADKITNARFELPTSTPTAEAKPVPASTKGQLLVSIRAAEGSAPIKSNIYVQKQDGTHVAKKNYDDNADFLLEAGTYKITVKADGRKDSVRTVRIGANGTSRETFALQLPPAPPPTPVNNQPVLAEPRIQEAPRTRPAQDGVLNMILRGGPNLPDKARFIVRDENGERVANIDPSSRAEVRLPAGTYEVVAALGRGMRQSRIIDIVAGKPAQVDFSAADIVQQAGGMPQPSQPAQPVQQNTQQANNPRPTNPPPPVRQQQQTSGRLQLHAISGVDGQPMRVNFTVSTLQGALIQAINDVSYVEVNAPVQDVVVGINYQSMNGRETIRVKPNEPTVYTFTVSPISSPPPPAQTPEQMLLETLQREILQRMQ